MVGGRSSNPETFLSHLRWGCSSRGGMNPPLPPGAHLRQTRRPRRPRGTHTTQHVTTDTETPACWHNTLARPRATPPPANTGGRRSSAGPGSRARQPGRQTDRDKPDPGRARRRAGRGHGGAAGRQRHTNNTRTPRGTLASLPRRDDLQLETNLYEAKTHGPDMSCLALQSSSCFLGR